LPPGGNPIALNKYRVLPYCKPGWLEIKWYTSALIYADDVNMLGGSVHTVKTNKEVLLVASKEIGLEENAEKN
jgi:hypothetical protein